MSHHHMHIGVCMYVYIVYVYIIYMYVCAEWYLVIAFLRKQNDEYVKEKERSNDKYDKHDYYYVKEKNKNGV